MTLLVDAGVTDDAQQKIYLTNGLKDAHKKKVDTCPWVFREADFDRCVELCRSFDLQNLQNSLPTTSGSAPSTAANNIDGMDWMPTVAAGQSNGYHRQQSNQGNQGRQDYQRQSNPGQPNAPRAKWVNKEELQHRKALGLCMRCGSSEHRGRKCPYQPAIRPDSNGNGNGSGYRPHRPVAAPVLDNPAVPPPQMPPSQMLAGPPNPGNSENEMLL